MTAGIKLPAAPRVVWVSFDAGGTAWGVYRTRRAAANNQGWLRATIAKYVLSEKPKRSKKR